MKKTYFLSLILTLGFLFTNVSSLSAQSSPCYVITGIPYAPDSLTAPTVVSLTGDDSWSGVINIGFTFCFFGNMYSQCIIGANGCVGFNLANAGGYNTWPINGPLPSANPADLENTIMLPWEDLFPPGGGGIKYQTLGTSPNRKFVVKYDNIPFYTCLNLFFAGEVALYESSNNIEIHIENKPICLSSNSGNAIEGIQNSDGTVAALVPGRYDTVWAVSYDGVRISPVCSCPTQSSPNIISGRVFRDDNSNCIQDVGEPGLANRTIRLDPWPLYYTTDALGDYVIHVDTGNYPVSQVMQAYNTQLCPSSNYPVYFATSPLTYPNADFADSVDHCHDISVGIIAHNQRVCHNNTFHVDVCNNGPLPAYNVLVTVTLPDSMVLLSPLNYISNPSPNVYLYSIDTVLSNQCINLNFSDSLGCIALWSTICFEASVTADSADCSALNNQDNECVFAASSFDPNEKVVASQNFFANSYVTQENIHASDTLIYKINFQNTGNASAFNVVVSDTISSYLDAGTIRVIASTHPYIMTITGNIIVFAFDNINLPDSNANEAASHGGIKFSMLQRAGNLPGTIIHNTAGIYFDVNLPVVTNQTENIIVAPTYVQELKTSSVKIYPNPTTSSITIENSSNNLFDRVIVSGIDGRVVKSLVVGHSEKVTVELKELSSGIYFLDCVGENGRQMVKVVKY